MRKLSCLFIFLLFLLSSCAAPSPASDEMKDAESVSAAAAPSPASDEMKDAESVSAAAAPSPASDEMKDAESVSAAAAPDSGDCRYEGDGFDSPESAVLFFLDGLKNLDFEQMLTAYAWETRESHYSAEEYLRYLRTFTDETAWIPGPADIVRRLNLEKMRTQEACLLYRSVLMALLPEDRRDGNDYFTNAGFRDTYLSLFDSEKTESFKEMTRVRFLIVPDVVGDYMQGRRQDTMNRKMAPFHPDEVIILPTVADIGSQRLFMAPVVVRYSDRWYLFTLDSPVMRKLLEEQNRKDEYFAIVDELPFSDILARDAEEADRVKPASRNTRYEGDGFSTPEEAVTNYLEGLKNLDLNRMLRSFAWEKMAARYDSETALWLSGTGMYTRIMPSFHSFAVQAQVHVLRSEQLSNIYRSFGYCLLPDDFYLQKNRMATFSVGILKEDEQDELLRHFAETENERLEKLTRLAHIRFISPDDIFGDKLRDEDVQKRLDAIRVLYGADEARHVVAIADIDEQHLYLAPTAIRYGDQWYLAGTYSRINMYLENTTFMFSSFGRGFAYGSLFPL